MGLLFFAALLPAREVQAQTGENIALSASIGLDGYCKSDRWFPVRVVVENNGSDLEGQIEVLPQDSSTGWRYVRALSLPAVSRKEVTVYVYPRRRPNTVSIRLTAQGRTVRELVRPVSCIQPYDLVAGVWAGSPSVFNLLSSLDVPRGQVTLAQLGPADIPDRVQGLDMLDLLVISDVDTGALSDSQRQVIRDWVANGGRLVVTGGPGWAKTTAGLGDLLPLQVSGTQTLPNLSALEALSVAGDPLTGEAVVATGQLRREAVVLAAQDGLPLIVRQQSGYGEVYFFAPDPSLAPLRTWNGLEQLYQSLFSTAPNIPSWASGFEDWRAAADAIGNIPGLALPSVLLICGFLGLYVFTLGPLNYAVLRWFKRREWAWFTVPAVVVLFSGVAFVIGMFIRGNRAVINQVAIVQVWPERENARVHGMVGVFSPSRRSYRIELGDNFLMHPDPWQSELESWTILQTADGAAAEDVRIDVGGIRGVAVSGVVPAPQFAQELALEYSGGNKFRLIGSLQNNSQITLRDAVVLGPEQPLTIGDFRPGETKQVNLTFSSGRAAAGGNSGVFLHGVDSTLVDVFGTGGVFGIDDTDLARRFNLLSAALGNAGRRGNGFYLIGWSGDFSPLNVTLGGLRFREAATTIFIVSLTPQVAFPTSGNLTLPPSFFTWSVLEANTPASGPEGPIPYDTDAPNGSYSLRFQLSQPIEFTRVDALVLHLNSYGNTGPSGLRVYLWDFQVNDWQLQDVSNWGDYVIPNPERYVGFGGEIRLQIENPTQNYIPIEASDFTLVVGR